MAAPKALWTVRVVGGTDGAPTSREIYSGRSLQFARHDFNTAKTTAILGGGTALIVLRTGPTVIETAHVFQGQTFASPEVV